MPPARKKSEPALTPPTRAAGGSTATMGDGIGLSEPLPITTEQLRAMVEGTGTAVTAGPTLTPPGTEGATTDAAAGAGGVTGTWRSGMTVTAMWSINEARNAWMYVSGLGWRKLYNGRDGAFMALVALAGQARQTGRQIVFREEADGMVYEIYLW